MLQQQNQTEARDLRQRGTPCLIFRLERREAKAYFITFLRASAMPQKPAVESTGALEMPLRPYEPTLA